MLRVSRIVFVTICFIWFSSQAKTVTFNDPKGDTDHGVTFPDQEGFRAKDFDLVRLSLSCKAKTLYIQGEFAAPVRRHTVYVFSNKMAKVFFQQIEVYLSNGDDHGHVEFLPGRMAHPAVPWDHAVLVTGLPEAVAVHLDHTVSDIAKDVCIPRDVRIRGRMIVAQARCGAVCAMLRSKETLYFIGITALRPASRLKGVLIDRPGFSFDPFVVGMADRPGGCRGWDLSKCVFGARKGHPAFLDAIGVSLDSKALAFISSEGKPGKLRRHRKIKYVVTSCKSGALSLLIQDGSDKTTIRMGTLGQLIDGESVVGSVVVVDIYGDVVVLKPVGFELVCKKGLEVRF